MQINLFSSIDDFLAEVQPVLRENEAANNLMLGIALRIQSDGQAYGTGYHCAAVYQDEVLAAALLMTPPYHLVIHCTAGDGSDLWPQVISELRQADWPIPGVFGHSEPVHAFAEAWQKVTGEKIQYSERMRTFELKQVIWPKMPGGFMRKASIDDLDLVLAWQRSFEMEALDRDAPSATPEQIRRHIEDGDYYLWVECEPVSMAATVRPVGDGISISNVYTPPEKRQNGYASGLVATLSQLMLDRWYKYVTLFTDRGNPTSNDIYQKIGYQQVCDYDQIKFVPDFRTEKA